MLHAAPYTLKLAWTRSVQIWQN